MKYFFPKTTFALAIITLLFVVSSGCDNKSDTPTQPSPNPIVDPPPNPTPPPPTPPPPEKNKFLYRIYPNENKPEEFIELVELKTECFGPFGNILGTGHLTISPTLEDEKIVPIERVVSLTFNKRGLVTERTIKGVGKVIEPIGYRESTIVLKNPDEEITGILVICRKIEGKLANGSYYSLYLIKEATSIFHKIELLHQ